jgi:hypothetical protein
LAQCCANSSGVCDALVQVDDVDGALMSDGQLVSKRLGRAVDAAEQQGS